MPKFPRVLLSALAISLSLMLLIFGGCGSSSDTIVRVQGASAGISKATLNHWMRAFAGEDFLQATRTKGPEGLVSEPADYGACASALRKALQTAPTAESVPSAAQIMQRCRALHRAVKEQALMFLISSQWSILEGAEAGVSVSNGQLRSEFARYRKQRYPTEADLQRYLSERHWTLADVLYQFKGDVLSSRLLPKFNEKVKRAGGTQQVNVKLALERYHGLIAKTSCSEGYVVETCKQYRGAAGANSQSGLQILAALTAG
jgi:hypothetical protein